MPTYVYACDECGQQFEQFQSFKDAPLDVCPNGHEGTVRRVFQPVGIVFKGSGWYITDSRKDGGSAENTGGSTGKKSSDSNSDNDASSKTEATSEATSGSSEAKSTDTASASDGAKADGAKSAA
jgi:putative FmdB family regulatory protein